MAGLRQILALAIAVVVSADSTLKVSWNTDSGGDYEHNAPIGPDGPWQAPCLPLKTDCLAVLPSLFYGVTLADKSIGGLYDPNSTPAKPFNSHDIESSELASVDYYKWTLMLPTTSMQCK